jgi:biotin carboxyl carrier protein
MRRRYQSAGSIYEIQLERRGKEVIARYGGEEYRFELLDHQPGQLNLRIGDRPQALYYAESNGVLWISHKGCTFKLEPPARPAIQSVSAGSAVDLLRAPMPAQVRSVLVEPGDHVSQGQTLLLLEAMKMEIRIQSPGTAQVLNISAAEGQQVEKDQVLVELTPEE